MFGTVAQRQVGSCHASTLALDGAPLHDPAMGIKDRINLFRMVLRAAERDPFGPRHVLDAIEEAAAKLSVDDRELDDLDADVLADIAADQTNAAEHLLGAAFVVVQGCVTGVVSRVARLHALAKARDVTLTSTNGSRRDLLAFGANDSPARIEIVEAAANYYKHNPEWPVMWKDPTDKRQERTIALLRSLGASSTSPANLLTITSALGAEFHTRATLYDDIFTSWRRAVVTAYRDEIHTRGLK